MSSSSKSNIKKNDNISNKLKRKRSIINTKKPPKILKFSRSQFKKNKSLGHATRDIISEITDYLSPILRLLFPNFIAVHYVYITFMTLLCSLMMLPITKASDGKYIDTLLLAAAATSQGGLNTVNINTMTIFQQFCLYFFCILTTPIFIHSVLAFVRLYWFERYFDGIRDWSKRNFKTRRTRTLLHQNFTCDTFRKPNLTKMWSYATNGGNKTDRVLSQYVSPISRTKSRGSTRMNTARRTASNKLSSIDYAKPPQKTKIKFGGADIDIKNRTNTRIKTGPKRVKSGFELNIKKKTSSTTNIDPLENSNKKSEKRPQDDEDFQSRLFRGEVVCRDEGDDDEDEEEDDSFDKTGSDQNNDSLYGGADEPPIDREENDIPIDEDVESSSYFNQKHKSLKTTPYLSPDSTESNNKKDNKKLKQSDNITTTKDKNNEQPQLHFDIPTKPITKRSTTAASWKPKFFSKVSIKDLKNKDVIELLDRKKNNNNNKDEPFERTLSKNDEKGILIPEDISPEELENLIHDPEFQKEVYKNWKHHQRDISQQRRMSSIQFPRLNTNSSFKQSLKKSLTSESKRPAFSQKNRTMSGGSFGRQQNLLKKTKSASNATDNNNIVKATEEWQDDGMDWENGKLADGSERSVNTNDEAIESFDEEDEDDDEDEQTNESSSHQTTNNNNSYNNESYNEDEDDDDYDDEYDNDEEDDDDDDDDEDDYDDDYDEGDIDFDYDYADDISDAPSFELVPTNNFVIGRNSKFVGLTDEQKEELGGVEYRALKLLCKYLVGYYIGFNLFAAVLFLGWICAKKNKPLEDYSGNDAAIKIGQLALEEYGIGRVWWGFFTSASSFNDLGLTLTPNSMTSFGGSSYIIIWSMFFIIIGNTGFPVFLRFVIWIAYKLAPQLSQRRESLQFLLEHPRRCFTLLFPRGPTWWLFFILVVLNGFDWIMFIILDYGTTSLKESLGSGWFRALNGLYQSVCTRTAGFSTTSLSALSPAVQVSYMLMMYVSVMPLAISIRRTNVYEEQSLGIYHDSSQNKTHNNDRTYTQRSSRSKNDSTKSPLLENESNEPLEEKDLENHASSFIGMHLRRQLSFDLWFLFLGLFIICICESSRIKDVDEPYFTIWTILFEIVSAYGTVGLSLGYPNTDTSFCAQFKILSKFIVVLLLLRGKHRGLPNSLDRAIMLPSDYLQQLDNKQFKLIADENNHEEDDDEEEDENNERYSNDDEEEGGSRIHSYNSESEERRRRRNHTREIDEEMDLGADNGLKRYYSHQTHTKHKPSVVDRDPVLHYFNKRKDQAKNFVNETAHAVLHPSDEYYQHENRQREKEEEKKEKEGKEEEEEEQQQHL
ncbi:hypothetical protein ACO0SA_001270 [Hanseniaspora valbyensis]